MPDKIRIGIVGLGTTGQIRKDIVEKTPGLDLVAVSDAHRPNMPRVEKFHYFEDYRKLLDSDIDAVIVAPQNKYRPKVVTAALEKGIHVLCETPPGRSVDDIRNIIDAEKKTKGVILQFGFTFRFHGAVQKTRELLDSKISGKILWMRGSYGKSGGTDFESTWRSNREWAGGGILLDQGIHILDLFRLFAGDFSEVKSMVDTSFWNISLEDNAFALMRTKEGQIASLHASSAHWKNRYLLEICLEDGFVSVRGDLSPDGRFGPSERFIFSPRVPNQEKGETGSETVTDFPISDSWRHELDAFADQIRGAETHPPCGSSGDALAAMKLVDKIYRNDRRWVDQGNLSGK